ncbi:MAG: T9SS C-terminal target domain-containing protein, partial [Chlorobiota bacterium]
GPVTLQYTLPGPGELVTEVFNILGEKIYSSSSQGETGVHSEQIDLASRAGTSGVYILRVSLSSGGKSYSKSVKVQVVK